MTNNKGSFKNTMVSLPVGLTEEAHKRNINVSAVCAGAISLRIIETDRRKEYEAWCAANPGNAYPLRIAQAEEALEELHDDLQKNVSVMNDVEGN